MEHNSSTVTWCLAHTYQCITHIMSGGITTVQVRPLLGLSRTALSSWFGFLKTHLTHCWTVLTSTAGSSHTNHKCLSVQDAFSSPASRTSTTAHCNCRSISAILEITVVLENVERLHWCIHTMRTNRMHYLLSIFIILTVQSLFIIHLYTNKIALKFTLLKTTH